VVVVSILIAFGLDAGWDSYRDRADLREDLVNVRNEVDANLIALQRDQDFQERGLASIEVVLDSVRASQTDGWLTLSDTIVLAALLFTPTYDPSTGAVDALIASGRLSELENGELQHILTEFRTKVEDLREDQLEAIAPPPTTSFSRSSGRTQAWSPCSTWSMNSTHLNLAAPRCSPIQFGSATYRG